MITSMFKRNSKLLLNESGNISIILALSILTLMLAAGVAIDYGRISLEKTRLQAAVDSAALYAASLNETTNGAITTLARPYFDANYHNENAVAFGVKNMGGSFTAEASTSVNNAFLSIVGMKTSPISAVAVVTQGGVNTEIALVLDNTGSMIAVNSKSGLRAIDELKLAAVKFVAQTLSNTQEKYYTKIGVVPYSMAVNLGANLSVEARGGIAPGTSTVTGHEQFIFPSPLSPNSSLSISNCVSERTGTAAYTDAPVSSYPVGLAYLPGSHCSNISQLVPLSKSSEILKSTINSMQAVGATAAQVGIAWGWYILSSEIGLWENESKPAAKSKGARKILVLMTDGEFNTGYAEGVPSYNTASKYINVNGASGFILKDATNGDPYDQAEKLCSEIKKSGIEIFVITFQLTAPSFNTKLTYAESIAKRRAIVNACASDLEHVIDADSMSLDKAFEKLSVKVETPRLTK